MFNPAELAIKKDLLVAKSLCIFYPFIPPLNFLVKIFFCIYRLGNVHLIEFWCFILVNNYTACILLSYVGAIPF